VPLAIIILVLGVYPKAVLRLQDPSLRALNAYVVTNARPAPSTSVATLAP
jgi:hypothetical protein